MSDAVRTTLTADGAGTCVGDNTTVSLMVRLIADCDLSCKPQPQHDPLTL